MKNLRLYIMMSLLSVFFSFFIFMSLSFSEAYNDFTSDLPPFVDVILYFAIGTSPFLISIIIARIVYKIDKLSQAQVILSKTDKNEQSITKDN